ncbi:MAG: methyltransferase domain-containing protein [Candidatus Peribacteraceae bacterium]|nr:methyltransferase domain-containing protein [Candidatus Peribacteraceae bacterium]
MKEFIDKYYKYIRPYRFLYGWAKDFHSKAKCSTRAKEWEAKGFKNAKLDICGGRNPYNPEEFLNVDIVNFPNVDLVFNITKKFPINDGIIEEIISVATLEHLRPVHVSHVINEFYRVLKPNGRVRISTPDIEAIAKGIIEKDDFDIILQHLFGKYKSNATEDLDLHKSMFPSEMMIEMLEKAGFKNAKRIPMNLDLHDERYNYLIEAWKE